MDEPRPATPSGPVLGRPGGSLDVSDSERLLRDALVDAGVRVGGDDERVLVWLAGWEPAIVAVLASWVRRASEDRP